MIMHLKEHLPMSLDSTKNLCDFLDASPTGHHAVDNLKAYLHARGALMLDEREPWKLEPGAMYMVARDEGALVAFRPGFHPLGDSGYLLAGAHVDSPGLVLRSGTERLARGMRRLAVDVYGGPILSGWLDRPLSLAGRVMIRREGKLETLLYNSERAVGIVPNLAIHLNREINKGMEYNSHVHLPVLVSMGSESTGGPAGKTLGWIESFLAAELEIDPGSIVGLDLSFHDVQKAVVFGAIKDSSAGHENAAGSLSGELINSPRLDDLAGCHAILEGFCTSSPGLKTQIACFFDAEEIGSRTFKGADSNFLGDIIARINLAMKGGAEDLYRAGPRSLCLSVDAAQAWNPAHSEKYDEPFSPLLGKGPAVKLNVNQKYATDLVSESLFKTICDAGSLPWQKYMARADTTPGSTIGPISAARLGIRTIDIGHPLLAMHAIRETIHGEDHRIMIDLLKAFYGCAIEF
jgi:aspartyl aminopeptidase